MFEPKYICNHNMLGSKQLQCYTNQFVEKTIVIKLENIC